MLLSQCPWKEYTADNGKIYYHNVTTKESKWVIPPELEEIKKKIAAEEASKGLSAPSTPSEIASPLAIQTTPVTPILPTTSAVNSPNAVSSKCYLYVCLIMCSYVLNLAQVFCLLCETISYTG